MRLEDAQEPPGQTFVAQKSGTEPRDSGRDVMSEADIIIVAAAIVVVGILVAGVVANAAHRHDDRRRFGPRQR
jgi:hypothetical protein